MKGLFNKLINKFTDTQSSAKPNTQSQAQKPSQNQTSTQNTKISQIYPEINI